jgi:hypothetical protein
MATRRSGSLGGMSETTLDHPELDPAVKPFHKPRELVDLGFASDMKTIYGAISRGEIPVVRVGRKMLVPTAWIRLPMGLDHDPAA